MKANKTASKAPLQAILEEGKYHYTAPAQFKQCKTSLGMLPFDAQIIVRGRTGLICLDEIHHFERVPALQPEEKDFGEQQEKNRIRNRFARDNEMSLLRVSHLETSNLQKWVTLFRTALEKENFQPVMIVSNPELYGNIYGDCPNPEHMLTLSVPETKESVQTATQTTPAIQTTSVATEKPKETEKAEKKEVEKPKESIPKVVEPPAKEAPKETPKEAPKTVTTSAGCVLQ